uniref:Uncharacterized protein n=1 Tax=Parascaris equorum TaxID=6256 RepID=A0A914RUI5_PAREQ
MNNSVNVKAIWKLKRVHLIESVRKIVSSKDFLLTLFYFLKTAKL